MERIISYDRKSLDKDERLTEEEFEKRLVVILPYVLGKIFQTIQKAMRLHDEIKNEIRPKTRLADFEIWGEAISRVLGYEPNSFVQTYSNKLTSGSVGIKDSYPIVAAIESLMQNRTEYEDTAERCFRILKENAKNIDIETDSQYVRFPKAPNQLPKQLTIISPLLKKLGIIVTMWHNTKSNKYTKNSSIISIRKDMPPESSPASLASPLETYTQNDTESSEDTNEGVIEISSL